MHFWTRHPEAIEPWDPDTEPGLHLTAYGHAFLELFHRMRADGRSVTIGPVIARKTSSVVVSMEELVAHQPQIPARMTLRLGAALLRARRRPAVVVLRVDTELSVRAPMFTTLEAMPTRASVHRSRQRVLPLLPQRGLHPRDASRGDSLRVIALKAYSYNVPDWMGPDFIRALNDLGLSLRIDTERDGRWEDFTDVDAVLCTHPARADPLSKPPTKLVAAWRAGAIPVCGPYVGYLETGRDGETMVVASSDSAEDYLDALRTLSRTPQLSERVRSALPAAAAAYAPDRVLRLNWEAFIAAPRLRFLRVIGAVLLAAPGAALSRLRRVLRTNASR
ncbi:hypothetical protein GCM10022383_06730 [Microbacterium soli]|uniref:Glycosyltransferase n=1 Tax=Microbacterium soli TaxID=446075 RepID=A0ABP7MYH3_9MICO